MEGKKVKEILQKRGLTVAVIASKMGTSRQNLNSKLKGADIGATFLQELAKAANIPLREFIPELEKDAHILADGDTNYNKSLPQNDAEKLRQLDNELTEMKEKLARIEKLITDKK